MVRLFADKIHAAGRLHLISPTLSLATHSEKMATHIAFEEQKLAAAYWALRGIQRQKEAQLVEKKIKEQQETGFLTDTLSDRSSHDGRDVGGFEQSPSHRLQRKLFRQNKRIARWAAQEGFFPSAVSAILGLETSAQVISEDKTPRSVTPADISAAKPPPTLNIAGWFQSTESKDQLPPRAMTPTCASFLSAVASRPTQSPSRIPSLNPPSGQVHIADASQNRSRRNSSYCPAADLRSAVKTALNSRSSSHSSELESPSKSSTRCHSPRGTRFPTRSVGSSSSTDAHSFCSSMEGKPWRRSRRLSNASASVLQLQPAALRSKPAKPASQYTPDRIYMDTGVHMGQAKQLELRCVVL